MLLAFRSPVTKPVLRAGTPKPVPPDPRAYDTFRVTQRFDAPDSFYAERDIREGRTPRTHGATDLGNFRCGDAVVAMRPGTVRRVKDNAASLGAATDGLGIIQDVGHGVEIVYWHLDAFSVPSGAKVAAGQRIGTVGRTGLGNVCHLHIEVKVNGRKVDPEPLIFGGSLTIEEDDVNVPSDVGYLATGTVGAGNRLRAHHSTTDGSAVTEKAVVVIVFGVIRGATPYTIGGKSGSDWYYVGHEGRAWYAAKPLVTNIAPTGYLPSIVPLPQADCTPQETTIAQLTTKIARARTANGGARQASEAVEVALR